MAHRPKRLLIQGATGSIGQSTLSVVREHPEHFRVVGLASRSKAEELRALAEEFSIESIALEDEAQGERLSSSSGRNGRLRIFCGKNAVQDQARETDYDLLVNALSGGAGLEPTVISLERGIPVALANKETLVAAGPLVMALAAKSGAAVLPIDSEHSAIFQCLTGERISGVRRLWLTTSGGPFWGKKQSVLRDVSVQQALAHPTWKMGPKVTIDSATLFNKGLEVIEAQRLFGVEPDCIEVIAHRQSIVHSMIEFIDGSFKAQLSVPDMRLPILYALSYPERVPCNLVQTRPEHLHMMTFEPVVKEDYPCLALAFEALKKGGTAPAALSAADEIAVDAFLHGQIRFTDIADVIGSVVHDWPDASLTDLSSVRSADNNARILAAKRVALIFSRMGETSCC
jgi:1-deoxy-D-xylulose-5-phosphate reductoisomerase